MAGTSPIYTSAIRPGQFFLQGGWGFEESQWDFDEGVRIWLTHPDTPRSQWPKKDAADSLCPSMYITDVSPRYDDSGLIEITAKYQGLVNPGAPKRARIIPNTEAQMLSIPAIDSGKKIQLNVEVPVPTLTRSYPTITEPDNSGVGSTSSEPFLYSPPEFSITWNPDPDQALAENYLRGWVLQSRTWQDVAGAVWLVREYYAYFYGLSA